MTDTFDPVTGARIPQPAQPVQVPLSTQQGHQVPKAAAITPAELEGVYNKAYANGKNSHTDALKAVYEAGSKGAHV